MEQGERASTTESARGRDTGREPDRQTDRQTDRRTDGNGTKLPAGFAAVGAVPNASASAVVRFTASSFNMWLAGFGDTAFRFSRLRLMSWAAGQLMKLAQRTVANG